MQNTSPGEIALQHLDRVRSDLKKDLESVEDKLTEIEAEGVVKRNRVEELVTLLHTLATLDDHFPNPESSNGNPTEGQANLYKAQNNLISILDLVEEEVVQPRQTSRLADVYNGFRERLMNTINALDIVKVALRKHTENVVQKQTQSQIIPNQSTGTETRSSMGSSAIIRSQELERQRIAREIHDGPAQAIANVVLRMDILSKIFEKDPTQVPKELAKMKGIAQGALDEIRGFIFDLRPMTLQDLGLVATIKRVISAAKDSSGPEIRFAVDGEAYPLGNLINLTMFRIAQEALNNIKKHSKCSIAWIHLKYLKDKVILIVEDDGCGFEIENVNSDQKKYASYGLLGMRERAADISAEFDISSKSGEGTKLILIVPTRDNPAMKAHWDEVE
ncbi:MAG: sensor histidine kinase [bacterium]|nr:sensor histidine kinase [bacterium]